MSNILTLRRRGVIEEEAAQWVWRLDSDDLSAADRSEFDSWLRRDPRHRRAFDDLTTVWSQLEELVRSGSDGGEGPPAAHDGSGRHEVPRRTGWGRFIRRPARRAAVAAVAAALVGGVAATAWFEAGREVRTLATAVGEEKTFTLADGSIVTLNTNTLIETDLRHQSREIHLRRGEAHFQVAHDRSRPFLVQAGDTMVRAVGTQFEVRLAGDRLVDVVVNEGSVEIQPAVAAPLAAAAPARSVGAGQRLVADAGAYAVHAVSREQLTSALAWREGAIVLDGEPLSEAIREVARYTDARIVISDPRIASLRVGGRFRTDDVQEFFDALRSALPVTVRRSPDGVVFIDPVR